MKTLYICGDSFAVADKKSSIVPWFELLGDKLNLDWQIKNNAMVCASNLHIRLQVEQAIADRADFVIMLSTSCTRGQGRLIPKVNKEQNIIDRFFNIGRDHDHKEFGCYSYNSLDDTCVFNSDQINAIQQYRDSVFDLELEIYQNRFIIESALHALTNSQTPFVFDQGGFENPKFMGSESDYFLSWLANKSSINLWSLVDYPMGHYPYFHINDQSVHCQIAEYYYNRIKCTLS
jgi:hypothetical protein